MEVRRVGVGMTKVAFIVIKGRYRLADTKELQQQALQYAENMKRQALMEGVDGEENSLDWGDRIRAMKKCFG